MHSLQRLVSTALIGALSFGCTESPLPSEAPEGAQPVAVQPLPADQPVHIFSGFDTQERLVIRDDATWTSVWRQAVGGAAPRVDFATQLVIAAAMGSQNTTGYVIDVDDVRTMDGNAWVSVTEGSPGPRCITQDAITRPLTLVAVPRYDGRTTFVEHTEQTDCE